MNGSKTIWSRKLLAKKKRLPMIDATFARVKKA